YRLPPICLLYFYFFLSRLLCHPRTTPFPYTTLFRSKATQALQKLRELAVQASNDTYDDDERKNIKKEAQQLKDHLIDIANTKVKDRKSTRLNSSHVSISYAVFCLKKKKKNHNKNKAT